MTVTIYFIIIFHTDILSHDTEVTILRSMIEKKEETNNLFEDKIRSKISFNNNILDQIYILELNVEFDYKHWLLSTDTSLS